MDTLIWTIIIGLATAFTVEFINRTLGVVLWAYWSDRAVRLFLTAPLAFGAAWLVSISWPEIFVVALAAGFISNIVLFFIDRASIVVTPRR